MLVSLQLPQKVEDISNIAWQGEEDMFTFAELNKNSANKTLKNK